MNIEIKILNKEFYLVEKLGASYYDTPDYQTHGAAALDLRTTEDLVVYPGETKIVPTGLAVWIGSTNDGLNPTNVAGIILPRSGLGTKGLVLANTIGLIDEDYQGELKIAAFNRNEHKQIEKTIRLKAGDRIAQLMFVPVIKANFKQVDEFTNKTIRGDGGFGSTGL